MEIAVGLSIMDKTRQVPLLWLRQLSDTGVPIGVLNHSFGLENVAVEESLSPEGLEAFLFEYLEEIGSFEIYFCGAAYRLGIAGRDRLSMEQWLDLNLQFSAFKLARESRSASATLGRRFLRLVNGLVESPILAAAVSAARETGKEILHCPPVCLGGDGG